ncbi:hypothetical protein SARC_13408 [Sphaeroforma arctica JP610]|uniref:Uncharacterized protein n=1 Tax=Sphaeroforma arctica JP610 TaxID=667725 RepID=A0A0L0FBC6_9EUKA|nr:hypothetical protein SARC_13408 [Sphaeroforma arctica JP610]KNC74034.1 hypothetical protein SARC_13408 [Sphaeroforma arctica JP610]|eukprot:XP_014147936.1 hypothetical protein SARC_13408 [Sphaeroforma arctica JP610]
MEDDDGPVVFERVLMNVQAMYPSPEEPSLSPDEIMQYVDKKMFVPGSDKYVDKKMFVPGSDKIMQYVDKKMFVPGSDKDLSEGEEVVRGSIGLKLAKDYPFSQCLTKFRTEVRGFLSRFVESIRELRTSVSLPADDNSG